MDYSNTIIACATAFGRAGISVIRLSGKKSFTVIKSLTEKDLPKPRVMTRRKIYRLDSDRNRVEIIDDVLIVLFKAPESYNGEDIVEIHCHGSIAVITAIIEQCCEFNEVRLSNAGEFTRRAVINLKQNVFQAEALIELIDAETEQQRKLATSTKSSTIIKIWQKKLLLLLSGIEADIEFSDSEEINPKNWRQELSNCKKGIEECVNNNKGIAIRNGIKVVLVGPPNVGKSSIFNKLSDKEIAIVTKTPGTTRDRLETTLNISGFKILLSDTAGLRVKSNHIESIGIKKSLQAIEEADILIEVKDCLNIDRKQYNAIYKNSILKKESIIHVVNKIDLLSQQQINDLGTRQILISAKTGKGFSKLHDKIVHNLKNNFDISGDIPAITRIRHMNILKNVIKLLQSAEQENHLEISAEHIRLAYNTLLGLNHYDQLTLQGGSEKVLDSIFAEFCIGK